MADMQRAYNKWIADNSKHTKDYFLNIIGTEIAIIEYRFTRISPPDNSIYYLPVRLSKSQDYFELSNEITTDFDYAVIMAVAFKHGKQGYAPAVRRLIIES